MIGKKENVDIQKSMSQVSSPNKIDMTMTRALAKVQVCFPSSELKKIIMLLDSMN